MEQQDLKILAGAPSPPFVPQESLAKTTETWLLERAEFAATLLRHCVEINPKKRGGIPVLKGTRFTVAQLFAEMAEGRSVQEIADAFELDLALIQALLQGFATQLDRPLLP